VLSGLLLALLGWGAPAFGHASAIGSTPADGQVLRTAPTELTVTFTEPVTVAGNGNAVLDADGRPQAATFTAAGNVLRIVPAAALPTGSHIVTWRVVSADSHPVTGGFTFAVGEATPGAVEVPTSQAQRELSVARSTVELVRYAGVLGLAGLLFLWIFVAPAAVRADLAVARRFRRSAVGLGIAGVLASLVLAPLLAVWESGGRLVEVAGASAWRDGLASSAGVAALAATVGVVLALLGHRRGSAVLVGGGIALLLVSLLPVGHTRSYGPAWLVLAADLVHVSAGALWWGGLLGLGVVLAAASVRVTDRAATVARFSSVAIVVLAALAVAGVVLFWRIAGTWPALWETGYGRAVLVKIALLLPVVAVAAWNRRVLVRRLRGREAQAAVTVLRRTVVAEALLVAGVLVATGVLVGQTPPARADVVREVPTVQRDRLELGSDARLDLTVTPVRRGLNSIQVLITDRDGTPVEVGQAPRLQVSSKDAGVGPMNRDLTAAGAGRWEARVDLPLPGTWQVAVAVRLDRFDEPVVITEVDVP